MPASKPLNSLPAFSELTRLAKILRETPVEVLFNDNPRRAEEFVVEAADLQLDYSKQLIDQQTLSMLLNLAGEAGLEQRISALLNGSDINVTENRPALHSLLRATDGGPLADKFVEVSAARARMKDIADRIQSGQLKGYTGASIRDVVNIGIGGSDLGPRLVTQALAPYHKAVKCHYVANVDPADVQQTLRELDPKTTLFIVCSKSFRTEETLANSLAAREWILTSGASENELACHFLAVTTNLAAATKFGIPEENCLPMWDWVGGRYSVWSAVGLSCAIAVGWTNFEQFLGGAAAMDEHFRDAPLASNMPVLMSLLEVWYVDFLDAGNHVILPYDHNLRSLPDFLQQLTMESNGKRVSEDGQPLDYPTGPVLWGSAGTNGQHSFHQLLHQGSPLCPADFILPLSTHTGIAEQHARLVANCLAQSRALMVGRTLEQAREALLARGLKPDQVELLAPHLAMPGNRPNSVITMKSLTPATLGALLALYEHRTFCSGQLWGINPFDQWGVELGKEIGADILTGMEDLSRDNGLDTATLRLMQAWQQAQE